MTDFEAKTYEELVEIHRNLTELISRKRSDALESLKAQMTRLGFDADDIAPKKKAKRAPPPIKYRNPENPDEGWTGRGRTPAWMQAMLDSGKTKEDFLVAA